MKSIAKLMVVAMLLAAALVVAPVAAARTIGASGDTVYVGEEDITLGFDITATQIVHYSDPTAGAIDNTIQAPGGVIPELSSTKVGTKTGPYYAFNASGDPTIRGTASGYVNVEYPSVVLDVVLNTSQKDSVASKSVTRDNLLDFKLTDNILIPTARIDIKVTTPGGGTTTEFGGQPLKARPLTGATQYIGAVDLTGAEAGTYTVQAKWPDTSDFYGKGFDSNTVTFEVSTKKLAITSDKDSVVRGKSFAVTIAGESKQNYILFVKSVTLPPGTTYPLIAPGQDGVTNVTSADWAGNFSGLPASTAINAPGLNYTQAWVKTTAGGTRTVQFNTTPTTDDRQFTIRVQDPTDTANYDEVKVKVEKGAVTITAAGTGTYYIGEEITLEGTCTESDDVYLFLTGPNLPSNGVNLTEIGAVVDTDAATFTTEVVEVDDTWSYKWNTGELRRSLDAGGYTIYAVSRPRDKEHLSYAQYDTISIQLRSGFISATSSGAVIAKGDDLKLTGTAQGDPDEVHVWIFGKNYYGRPGELYVDSATVEDDGTFEFELDGTNTEHLSAGQYFVVIQHPMMNKIFDIQAAGGLIIGTPGSGFTPVAITNLQAAAAANALIKALDSQNIDDTYVKLTFIVEEPRILIDPIGDVPAGSTFTISGTTNLAVGDTLNVEVTSAAFTPSGKGEESGFASVARTTEVKAGDGANVWSVEIDGSAFKPDQYIVTVECIETDTTETANFNVVEAVPSTPTVTPTGTVTTTTPPVETTVTPTETETPGFGALLALAGLGAVAYLVLRRD
jgi:PGF-CTERM protein